MSKETEVIVGDYSYHTSNLIGHGAFAIVYKGKHRTKPGLFVAIKTIAKKNLQKTHSLLGKEIKILEELTELHHENVVALLDYKETIDNVYLVMEFCNRGDLADYLSSKGTFSEDTIKIFLKQIAGAMKALYAKGIVHRDLKPQNILLCSKKLYPTPNEITLKIADFGFARFLGEGIMAATLCGSPMYMAPEVIMSLQYDAKADLWSIGTIVFQCLTGTAPFQAQSPQALKQFYEKNTNLTPKIPTGTSKHLTNLLVNLLKRNAKDRMEFDEFFNHPFIKPTQSSPVPVPRTSTQPNDCSSGSSSPPQSPVSYGSPVVMNLNAISPKLDKSPSHESFESEEQVDDFVMIPSITSKMDCNESKLNLSKSNSDDVLISMTELSVPPDPIPVPTQKIAYERIRKSCSVGNSSGSEGNWISGNNNANISSQDKENCPLLESKSNSLGSEGKNGNHFIPDLRQLSPPTVQFVIGTPPVTNISPVARRRSTPILGNNLGFNCQNRTLIRQLTSPVTTDYSSDESLFPIICSPDRNLNIGRDLETQCHAERPIKLTFHDSSFNDCSQTRFTYNSQQKPFYFTDFRCDKMFFNTSCQVNSHNTPLHHCCCGTKQQMNARRSFENSHVFFDTTNRFVAPELPEETLLDKDHNETLAKLNFVVSLVECIIKFAEHRGSAFNLLAESNNTELLSASQRQAEKLVLYVRALQLISSALQLSRQEVMAGRLKTSSSVRQVLRTMKSFFHYCLEKCKSLGSSSLISSFSRKDLDGISADKLIYDYAIKMCQSAALEELVGNLEVCFRRYQTAQILLHSLSQQVANDDDRMLLGKYKDAVERRLYYLQREGVVISMECNSP